MSEAIAPSARRRDAATDVLLLAALYVLQGGVLLAAASLLTHGEHLLPHLATRAGRVFAAALAAAVASGTVVALRLKRPPRASAGLAGLTVAMSVATVAVGCGAAEVVVRVASTATPQGRFLAGALLPPRDWREVAAHNLDLLRHVRNNISYFAVDPRLGWTIAPGRTSTDRLYASSVEGARSAAPGEVLAARRAPRRIVLVGDSYTFGLEVPFEASWGRKLEEALGPDAQVLNFGVDGYGVDQTLLRFEKDGAQLAPDLVVAGFIDHDLYRTMAVYDFVDFPTWGFPFAKPRFVRDRDGTPRPINLPLPSPEELFSKPTIEDLADLGFDRGYRPAEWESRWSDASFALRWLVARLEPPPRHLAPNTDEETIALNVALLRSLRAKAAAAGAAVILVYFPSRYDFRTEEVVKDPLRDGVLSALRQDGGTLLDLTSCLRPLGTASIFLEGRPHYAAAGNAKVAECLLPAVRDALSSTNSSVPVR